MPKDKMDSDDSGQTIAIRLSRLAVPVSKDQVPSFQDVGLEAIVEEATDWQSLRASSWFWAWGALVHMPAASWVEIGELFGSIGESVCLAATAEIEIEVLRRAIADGSVHAYCGISQRFFAEAQGNAILGVGHRLANMVARVLMTDKSYPWGVPELGNLSQRFPTKAKGREHWIALSRAADLHRIAVASPFASVRLMTDALAKLRKSEAWKKLEDQRGDDFHRWREESHNVSKAIYEDAPGSRTLSIFGSPDPDSAEGRDFIESVCLTSRSALDRLLATLTEIREAWMVAMEELSGGGFRWVDGVPHIGPVGAAPALGSPDAELHAL